MCKQDGQLSNNSTLATLGDVTCIKPRSPELPHGSRPRKSGRPTMNRFHMMTPVTPPWGMPSRPRPNARMTIRSIPKHSSTDFLHQGYDILHLLGKGAFGHVHLVQERTSKEEMVCKIVNTAGMLSDELEQTKEEVSILRRLDHPRIVQIHEYGYDKEASRLIVVLEYLSGGSSKTLLRKQGPLKEALVLHLISQVFDAVAYCHARGVVHRDLKPDHIMLVDDLHTGTANCKLIDFGLSILCSGARRPHDCSELSKRVGTPAYMAPEVVNESMSCSSKADVWSVGVTMLELLLGKNPFSRDERNSIFKVIKRFWDLDALIATMSESKVWHALQADTKAIINSLLRADPGDRLSAAQALETLGEVQIQDKRSTLLPDVVATSPKGQFICNTFSKRLGLSSALADKPSFEPIPDVFCRMPNTARVRQPSGDYFTGSSCSLGEEAASGWSLPLFARRRPAGLNRRVESELEVVA